MALRIWLPLDGDDLNRGISTATATTVTAGSFVYGGKVTAKCMQNGVRSIPYTYASTNRFSVALWVKPNSATAWTDMFGWGTGASRIEVTATGGTEYRYYCTSGGSLVSSGTVISSSIANGVWCHFAMVADGTTVKFFIDGALVKSASQVQTIASTFDTTNTVWVGGYNGLGTFNSYINDFRVYDHALSVKEVKELAMGMVVHYPMGGVGDACPNIATGSWNVMTARSMGQYYDRLVYDTGFFGLSAGDTYTYSVKLTAPEGRPLRTRLQFYNTDSDRPNLYGTIVPAGTTGYSVLTDTLTATQRAYARMELLIQNVDTSQTTSVTYYAGDLKLEKGGVATPWVPHTSSTAYTALGFNSTKLVDATGHGHDLTWSASPTVVSGSPRYMTASDFNASAYASRSSFAISLSTLTVSFWFKPRTMANQHFILGSFDSWTANGIGIYRDKANPTWFNILMRSSSQGSYCSFGGQQFTLDAWHFIVITWDSANAKVYLDGALKTTTAYAGGTCEFKNLYLGNSAYSGTPASETDECAMSDFRLYATALNADDITELYKAPVSFTKNGEVHACCISENTGAANPEVRKDGVVEAVAFSELYGRYDNSVRIEPDGSAWMRMVHHADPTSYLFSSSDSFATSVYKDARRWFHGKICDYTDRWEFMIVQKADSSASTLKYRWVQAKNPNTAAWAEVAASTITKNTGSGYSDFSTGGLYKINSNTFYCANNGTQGNWWGAVGAWGSHQGGIPAWGSVIVKDGGFEDLYIRLDGGATWSWPDNDRVSIIKTDKSITEYRIVEV